MPATCRSARPRPSPPSNSPSSSTSTCSATQRVNRAALPQLRKQGSGLVVWVSSSSARGGTPPYLSPYFAAKAAMDSLAVSYASELARWGIETAIIVPGAFTKGTNHFAHSGAPADKARMAEYETGPYAGVARAGARAASPRWNPPDADAADVAKAIVESRRCAFRQAAVPYPYRPVAGRLPKSSTASPIACAAKCTRRIGLEDLLHPAVMG